MQHCSPGCVILSTPYCGTLSTGAEIGSSWIPGLAVLARNDGLVVFVIPAHAGIQGVWRRVGILFLSSKVTGRAGFARRRWQAQLALQKSPRCSLEFCQQRLGLL